MIFLKKLVKQIDNLSEFIGKIFIWLIVPLTLIDVYEVFSRYVLNSPHIWSMDVTTWLYGMHFMLLAGYTLLYKRHVFIDIFYARWSPRTQALVDTITYLLFFFPFCIIIINVGIKFVVFSWSIRETTATSTPLPLYLYKTIFPISMILLVIQGLSELIKKILFYIKGVEL